MSATLMYLFWPVHLVNRHCAYLYLTNDIIILFNLKVKEIEKRDSVLTGPQQIERLTRPGSTYFNLNPYEVNIYYYTLNSLTLF